MIQTELHFIQNSVVDNSQQLNTVDNNIDDSCAIIHTTLITNKMSP